MVNEFLGLTEDEYKELVDDFIYRVDYQLKQNEFNEAEKIINELVYTVLWRYSDMVGGIVKRALDERGDQWDPK